METQEPKNQLGGRQPWFPLMYAMYYNILKGIATEHGYALAIHGSLTRDLDLIAVPWVEDPKPPEEFLMAIRKTIGWNVDDGMAYDTMVEKPHGRIAYTIKSGGGGYLDISILPTMKKMIQ